MIDNRFGRSQLESAEGRSALIREFKNEIEVLVDKVIQSKVHDIVMELNSRGHHLTLYCVSSSGGIAYRDDKGSGDDYKRDLVLGVDCVVSVAFRSDYYSELCEDAANGGDTGADSPGAT